ncbi:hypothetical protein AMIS_30850 [Actinoplanes missouriensis 431]|uniref:Uncharacterized protein n=1 Tax=Actinoplanes missouriensis (strain ATCC 14538 / DSM 43046 / CBS 188.64 / JCM 3121 / NBRC 102363 / NCIMB 12654 / NRRL B-3342 / UNCC 431) TaxID=512565 RepID=I0H5L8_ACTM4|nr:hypothetical protein [Actinoplanes missouriensis]BAL88305.1 hypothetical protein AMIS_30850 [Actinoplanes missouriensis 431]
MPYRYYRRHWDDTRGDEFDAWGHSTWFFEVADDGLPVRQVEMYAAGPVMRYGPDHEEDRYAGLSEAPLYEPGDDWSRFEITEAEFERAWKPADQDRRRSM